MDKAMRPNYGIDAPELVRAFLLAGVGFMSASAIAFTFKSSRVWAIWAGIAVLVPAIYSLFMFCLMIWGSLVDKVRGREAILNLVPWKGSERVLDVGCGRGLMLVGAARRLTTGRAVGVDIWLAKDQSSNRKEAAIENARIEGVAGRVATQTADMRELPFPDHSFDVVVSSWAIHNLETQEERTRALKEIARVVRPTGLVLLTDIANRREYASAFGNMGFADVRLVILSALKDRFFSAVSFGSFQPATIIARKVSDAQQHSEAYPFETC